MIGHRLGKPVPTREGVVILHRGVHRLDHRLVGDHHRIGVAVVDHVSQAVGVVLIPSVHRQVLVGHRLGKPLPAREGRAVLFGDLGGFGGGAEGDPAAGILPALEQIDQIVQSGGEGSLDHHVLVRHPVGKIAPSAEHVGSLGGDCDVFQRFAFRVPFREGNLTVDLVDQAMEFLLLSLLCRHSSILRQALMYLAVTVTSCAGIVSGTPSHPSKR